MHNTIQLRDLSVHYPNKICFDNFSQDIYFGDRIAIIGDNGTGKTSLLKMISEQTKDVQLAYVPQIIDDNTSLSGAERFNKALSTALTDQPDILLLDEPSNHLDQHNRQSLLRMLNNYYGTLIIVSHDVELLNHCINTLWHIQQQQITVFSGDYTDYINTITQQQTTITKQKQNLKQQQETAHEKLMHEQQRAAHSREKGKKNIRQRKWATVVSNAKADRAGKTAGTKKSAINNKQQQLQRQQAELFIPKKIIPRFSITASELSDKTLLAITNAEIAYADKVILTNINLTIAAKQRIAITGANGSGKSSLFKAILNNPTITKAGDWLVPNSHDIGYLDQHYQTLVADNTVFETIAKPCPDWPEKQIRQHLSDFLFFSNEQVNSLTKYLSGGEKARLCLAQIAAKTPKLLLLDELTNNLDLTTRQHVIEVLQAYPGAILIISHDENFLAELNINQRFMALNQTLL